MGEQQRKRAQVKRIYTWTCAYCGMDFTTENYSQRYCKPSHKQRAYELRREQRAGMSIARDALTVTPQDVTIPTPEAIGIQMQERAF